MCIFSRPVRHVGQTRIFARGREDGLQALAYQMSLQATEELAMVLPLPVPEGAGEEAARFVSLEGFASFFPTLDALFPEREAAYSKSGRFPRAQSRQPLVVHEVGAFVASFVPTARDFERLDPRFRLPERVWERLPEYADHGFAVFQLKPRRRGWFRRSAKQTVHPMALWFPRRDPDALTFPTVHVHDGEVSPRAEFDHDLYCQTDPVTTATLDWTRSSAPLGPALRRAGPTEDACAAALELVDGEALGYRTARRGWLPNRDLVLRRPPLSDAALLRQRGAHHQLSLRTLALHDDPAGAEPPARWQQVVRERLEPFARELRAALAPWLEERAQRWELGPWGEELPEWLDAGDRIRGGPDLFDGVRFVPQPVDGAGRCSLRVASDSVEPQELSLAFRAPPDAARLREIRAEVATLLDRIAAG